MWKEGHAVGKAYSKVNHQHLVCINFTKMLTTSSSHANFNQITREKRSQILRDNEILRCCHLDPTISGKLSISHPSRIKHQHNWKNIPLYQSCGSNSANKETWWWSITISAMNYSDHGQLGSSDKQDKFGKLSKHL